MRDLQVELGAAGRTFGAATALGLFCATVIGACVAPGARRGWGAPPRSSDEVRAAVEREFDPYSRVETWLGPRVNGDDGLSWRLRRRAPAEGAARFALDIEWSGAEWRFFESAYVLGGRRLELSSTGRDVLDSGRVRERIAVEAPLEWLESAEEGPLRLRLFGAKGHADLALPRYHVRGFLAASTPGRESN